MQTVRTTEDLKGMETTELVWVTECEVCGKEHKRTETCQPLDLDDLVLKAGTFERRCEHWYREHLALLTAQRIGHAVS